MASGLRNDSGGTGARPRRRGRFWPIPVLTLLVALPLAAWMGAYFWVNSTPGRALVGDWLLGRAPAGRLVIGAVHWGPLPDELHLGDVLIRDEAGRPLIHATEVTADVVVSHLLEGDLVVDRARASGYFLELAWDEEGKLNVARALARPKKPGSGGGPPKPRRLVELRRIELVDGDLTLAWPSWGMQFSDVDAHGALTLDRAGQLAIHADLHGGRAHALWGKHDDKAVHVNDVDIVGFHWADQGFDVDRLGLTADDGSLIDVAGTLELAGDLELDVQGDVALGATIAPVVLGRTLPTGGRVDDLELTLAGTTLTGRAHRVTAPSVEVGPVSVTDVATAVDDFTFVPGLIKPSGAVALHDTRVSHLTAPGLDVRDTRIGKVAVAVRSRSTATLDDVVARALTLEDRVTLGAKAHIEASFGLTSGEVDANIVTDMGRIGASGSLRVSPFSKKLTVSLRVALEQVGGSLATYLVDYLPPAPGATLGAPLEGFAVFRTVLGKDKVEGKKGKHWVAETRLEEAQLEGGGHRVVYDGEAWAATAVPAPPATP
ncbi:MAG: hypothetical protein EP329_20900 [Deltaproteobacteria bacterium]|nr:MAG: hypothetical protein EP329_20900 [Deltaproteobacteria bacterium]